MAAQEQEALQKRLRQAKPVVDIGRQNEAATTLQSLHRGGSTRRSLQRRQRAAQSRPSSRAKSNLVAPPDWQEATSGLSVGNTLTPDRTQPSSAEDDIDYYRHVQQMDLRMDIVRAQRAQTSGGTQKSRRKVRQRPTTTVKKSDEAIKMERMLGALQVAATPRCAPISHREKQSLERLYGEREQQRAQAAMQRRREREAEATRKKEERLAEERRIGTNARVRKQRGLMHICLFRCFRYVVMI